MRRAFIVVIGLALCVCILSVHASAQMEAMPQLDIYAVKKVSMDRDKAGYWANVVVALRNGAPVDVRIRNFKFELSFEKPSKPTGNPTVTKEVDPKASQLFPFGKGEIGDVTLPKSTTWGGHSPKSETLRVFVGPDSSDTTRRMAEFVTLIGDPSEDLKVFVKGSGEIGREVERGWIYQGNMIIELKFTPTLQREWLMK